MDGWTDGRTGTPCPVLVPAPGQQARGVCLTRSQRSPGRAPDIAYTGPRKLIFNEIGEISMSWVIGERALVGGAGLQPRFLLGFELGARVRALASEAVFGGGPVQRFNEQDCLRRLQKRGFSKGCRGTLLRQQRGRQLSN